MTKTRQSPHQIAVLRMYLGKKWSSTGLSLSFTVPVPLKHRSHESISNNAGNSARAFLWILLALTLVRGILYAIFNPPFGSPDETEHFKYVAYLATGGAAGPIGAEQHQPVPYYALMVPAYWLTASYPDVLQNLAIRIASLPLLLGIVAFTWLAAREMAPNKPLIAVVATAFVALHPENTVIAASANNDTAANLWPDHSFRSGIVDGRRCYC